MSIEPASAVIVFDGVCVLCNGWVHFLLRHDRSCRYRFAAMQSSAGRTLLSQHGLDPDSPASLLLIDDSGAWTDTQAIGRIFAGLGGRWRWASVILGLMPLVLRDRTYRLIARHRYRWFGRRDNCLVPAPNDASRFLN